MLLLEKSRIALEAAERAGLIASRVPHQAIGSLLLAGFCRVYTDPEGGRTLIGRAAEIAESCALTRLAVGVRGYAGTTGDRRAGADRACTAASATRQRRGAAPRERGSRWRLPRRWRAM